LRDRFEAASVEVVNGPELSWNEVTADRLQAPSKPTVKFWKIGPLGMCEGISSW
jgi:hypothetical protein